MGDMGERRAFLGLWRRSTERSILAAADEQLMGHPYEELGFTSPVAGERPEPKRVRAANAA